MIDPFYNQVFGRFFNATRLVVAYLIPSDLQTFVRLADLAL